jgi:hypothetical protein
VNAFEDKLWNSERLIASLSAVQFLIADHEDARLPLKNLADGIVAQAPQHSDFRNSVMPGSEARTGPLVRIRIVLGVVRFHRHLIDCHESLGRDRHAVYRPYLSI